MPQGSGPGNPSASEFETMAEAELAHLAQRLDEQGGDDLEVDYEGGILTIELEDGRQYVINRHAVNRQIWVSSPVSGAAHFRPVDGGWRSTRGGPDLRPLLTAEFSQLLDRPIELD